MFIFLFTLTACLQDLDTSSFQNLEPYIIGEEEEVADPNAYLDPLIVDWVVIEDAWFGTDDVVSSKEGNLHAYEILLSVYTEEFHLRAHQYRNISPLLTLEVEYLFGMVLRSMKRKKRLSQKNRKKQLAKLKVKLETLLDKQ